MDRSLHQLPIADAAAISSVMFTVKGRLQTTDCGAGKALGIGQSLFTRLKNGKHTSIRSDNYEKIRDKLRDNALALSAEEWFELDLHGQFEESVMSWEAAQGKAEYDRWLRTEHARLKTKVTKVFEALRGDRNYYALFMARLCVPLTRRSEFPPSEDHRLWMAIYRALEPLTDSEVTGGVERSWVEMHEAGHLAPLLRGALDRERWMLEREPDDVRATKAKPSDEYLADLAGEEAGSYAPPGESAGWDGVDGGGKETEGA